MLPLEPPDRIHVAFDDHRLVANAGLLLPAASPCTFPGVGPGKPSSVAPSPGCGPCRSPPDGTIDVRPRQVTQWLSLRLAPGQPASAASCLPPGQFHPSSPLRATKLPLVWPRAPLATTYTGIGLGPFALPCPSCLLSTPTPHPFGGFGLN